MRYFKIYNNAMTIRERGRGRMAYPSLFGFGQTDPVLDAEPGAEDPAATDAAAQAAQATAAGVPVSRIEFYPDGTTIQRGVTGNTLAVDWWKRLESALGVPAGQGRTADSLVQMANDLHSSKQMWKWVALIGVPVVGVAAFFGGREVGRRGR